jgi:cytochrome c553
MRNEVAAPLARGDMKAISAALRKVATIAPPAWASWSATALEGASAADQNNRAALRAACNNCHQTWRDQYKQRYREKPLPP